MTFSITRERLLASTMIGGFAALVLAAAPAAAQDGATAAAQAAPSEDIVVTGSRIVRKDYSSTSPIVTVGQSDLQATGSVTAETLMNDMPQFMPGTSNGSVNPGNGGQANLNLRGLGSNRTLVLMNGRRIVPSNANGTVDINLIPSALIRNVEVISGGASATYGSDALAGVANFILNDNFSGVQLDAQYGVTEQGDGATQSYTMTIGGRFDDGRGHAVLSVGRSTREAIMSSARGFSAVSGRNSVSPLGVTTFDSTNLPSQAFINNYLGCTNCVTPTGEFGYNTDGSLFSHVGAYNFKSPGGPEWDAYHQPGVAWAYNTGATGMLSIPLERWNAFAAARYELADSIELYSNVLFTQYSADTILSPTPMPGPSPTYGFRVPSTNPFITADLREFLDARPDPTASFGLNKRFNAIGGRLARDSTTVFQVTAGLRGDLPFGDWRYDLSGQYGRVDNSSEQSGNVSRSAVQRLLDDPTGGASLCEGGFNPFGLTTLSKSCIAYINRNSKNSTLSEQTIFEGTVQGGLFQLPAGQVRVALGAQYREDSFAFRPDSGLSQSNPIVPHLGADGLPDGGRIGGVEVAGFNPVQPLTGSTNSTEFFVEALIPVVTDLPLIKRLELTLGYRYSDYSTIGGVQAYKADVDWTVFDSLRVRGGIQRAVRAPSIGELYGNRDISSPQIGGPVNAQGAPVFGGDPCDIRGAYRNGPDAAQVRQLCLAQGLSAAAVDSYVFNSTQIQGFVGGNVNLKEETADTWTVGAVYRPNFGSALFSRLSASIDYYSIKITDVVGSITATNQLQGCFNATGVTNPTYDVNNGYCQLFERDPLTGNVINSLGLQQNLATLKTSGIDLQVDWSFDLADAGLGNLGSLNLNYVVGWLRAWQRQDAAGGPFNERAGTIDSTNGFTFPKWKMLGSVNYSNGPFGLGLRWRRVGKMDIYNTANSLPAINYFDLLTSWNVSDSFVLRMGVNNLTDKAPRTWTPGIQSNTDPSTYDILGRRFFVGVTSRF
ncbi:TonB-dependent receptor [Sphingopyxis sp. SCN 67-31]|uniref:TonB-dependent receptor domain-containing protein n=1 Tax=Sphingopyxis sp. SCN 67-31 TaxID=1660142 RepID=UPI000AB2E30F|nr:TonB-dependent receptor [Sphingopyxis sp. SCN 67-31]